MNIYNFYNVYGAMVKRAADDDVKKTDVDKGPAPQKSDNKPVGMQTEKDPLSRIDTSSRIFKEPQTTGGWGSTVPTPANIEKITNQGIGAYVQEANRPRGWGDLLADLRNNPKKYLSRFDRYDAAAGGSAALITALLTGKSKPLSRLVYSLLAGTAVTGASRLGRELYDAHKLSGKPGFSTLPARIMQKR